MRKTIFIRLRAENYGCKPVDEYSALRRMSLSLFEGGPAVAKRRRVFSGTTDVKPWGSIITVVSILFLISNSVEAKRGPASEVGPLVYKAIPITNG